MIEVNPNEYRIVQQFEKGFQRAGDMDIDMSHENINHYLSQLCKRGIIERVSRGMYKRTNMEVIPVEVKSNNPDKLVYEDIEIDTTIDDDKMFFLIHNYDRYTRTELVKKLGIPKQNLNQIIIENDIKIKVEPTGKTEQNRRAYLKRKERVK